VNLVVYAAKNLKRNQLRLALTALGGMLAVLVFLVLRTVLWTWNLGTTLAAKDRLGTRDRVSFINTLPKRYAEDIVTHIPGVKAVCFANWWGGQDPKDEHNFFATLAVDPATLLDVYPEFQISPEARQRWLGDKQAALIGENLARHMKVKEGDKVVLTSQIFHGMHEFHVAGIYTTSSMAVDKSSFYFHWDYMNEQLPERRRDQVGWIITRIDDPRQSAATQRAIDKMFEERDSPTLTQSERELQNSFLGMFSSILVAIQVVSVVILVILLLILGNTIAMGARERTYEYGVLRALGFRPGHIAGFIVGEGLLIGLLGGVFGLALGWLLIRGIGGFVEQMSFGYMFPYFQLAGETAALGLGAALLMGGLAAAIPAWRASRLSTTAALRRVG
jgi:putative ABC transport system permease protein